MEKLTVNFTDKKYDIIIKRDVINELSKYIDLTLQYVIITDDFIPKIYLNSILSQLKNVTVLEVPMGESSKSMKTAEKIMNEMIDKGIERSATIIALGGGVIGDLTGFIASVYMRGIKFIQIPTTLLSQVDSSVGGKVGVNASHMKNAIGQFYQPSLVLVDPNTLNTLEQRQVNNGMGELIKYGCIYDKDLFYDILNNDIFENIEKYIKRSLEIKRDVVIEDERDLGIRQILNFGHTIGHAIEAYNGFSKYLHGESIALGMVYVTKNEKIKSEIVNILQKYNLPITTTFDKDAIYKIISTDKKVFSGYVNLILLKEIGKYKIVKTKVTDLYSYLEV